MGPQTQPVQGTGQQGAGGNPEALVNLLSAVAPMFAQQDVTSVADPTQPRPEMGEGLNTILNVVEGLDPSFGILTGAAGLRPDRPDVSTQLAAGLLGPGIPGGARGVVEAATKHVSSGRIANLVSDTNFSQLFEGLLKAPANKIEEFLTALSDEKTLLSSSGRLDEATQTATELGEKAGQAALRRRLFEAGDAEALEVLERLGIDVIANPDREMTQILRLQSTLRGNR